MICLKVPRNAVSACGYWARLLQMCSTSPENEHNDRCASYGTISAVSRCREGVDDYCDNTTVSTHPVMISHDGTWHDASGCVCSQTRGHRLNIGTLSSSRVGWQGVHASRAPGAGLCCRSGSGTGTGRDGSSPREAASCAASSTSSHKCYRQTVDVRSPAMLPTDSAATLVENLEVELATEPSADRHVQVILNTDNNSCSNIMSQLECTLMYM